MFKKTACILVVAAASTVNAEVSTELDPFRAKLIEKPIEFANIAIGRSDGRRPGIINPIEFASNVKKGGLCPPLLCSDGVNPS